MGRSHDAAKKSGVTPVCQSPPALARIGLTNGIRIPSTSAFTSSPALTPLGSAATLAMLAYVLSPFVVWMTEIMQGEATDAQIAAYITALRVKGETVEEIKEKAFAHAGVVHAEILNSMTDEQKADLAKTLEANIKPA